MIYCIFYQYPCPNLDILITGMGRQLHSTAGPQLEPLKLWYGLVITFHRFFEEFTTYLRPNSDGNTANICPDKIGIFVK